MSRAAVAACLAGALLGTTLAGEGGPRSAEPDRVTVQHVLVGFKGSVRGKAIARSRQDAESLARELLRRASEGEDFSELVRQHTDDRFPGIYKLVNRGVEPRAGEVKRYDMVTHFGNVAFGLATGEVGLAEYHSTRSPHGWHVIKRLE